MADPREPSSKRILEPYDRVSEVLFGLIMVLTFTGSLSIAEAGRDDIRTMLIGALGCNLAWGLIDGVFYLMGCLAEKSRGLSLLCSVRAAPDPASARRHLAEAFPPLVATHLQPPELDALAGRLRALPVPPGRPRLRRDDWLGALAVFLWVFLTTFPVVLPFVFMTDARIALRTSNGIAILLLLAAGWAFGRIVGRNPWLTGVAMVFLGALLVALTMALGG